MLVPAILALLPGALAGMYGKPVINLDAKTFKQAMSVEHASVSCSHARAHASTFTLTLHTHAATLTPTRQMVAFVAPWCGHCKNLAPEFQSAASSLSPLIPFYAVDCDDAGNKALCGQYDIKGFPTIKAFPRALKGAARDYSGPRKAKDLVEYAKTLVPDRVKKLRAPAEGADAATAAGADKVVRGFLDEKKDLPHVLLVHPSQPSIPFLWKVLGHRMSSQVSNVN